MLFFSIPAYSNLKLPKEHQQKLQKVLTTLFKLQKPETIETLSGGFSSPGLYKITIRGKPYVVRYANSNRSQKDRERELHAMMISSKRGLAPRVLYGDAKAGIILMEFVENRRSLRSEVLKNANIEALAKTISKLHQGPQFNNFVSVIEIARDDEKSIKGKNLKIITEASGRLNEIEKTLESQLTRKPCHNDLNPNNILFSDGKVILLDWELSGQQDPFFDIATIFILYAFEKKHEDVFLKAYFGHNPRQSDYKKLQLMKQLVMIYNGFAYLTISQAQGVSDIHPEKIQKLPRLLEHCKKKEADLLKNPENVQEFGYVLLNEVLFKSPDNNNNIQ